MRRNIWIRIFVIISDTAGEPFSLLLPKALVKTPCLAASYGTFGCDYRPAEQCSGDGNDNPDVYDSGAPWTYGGFEYMSHLRIVEACELFCRQHSHTEDCNDHVKSEKPQESRK